MGGDARGPRILIVMVGEDAVRLESDPMPPMMVLGMLQLAIDAVMRGRPDRKRVVAVSGIPEEVRQN